MERPFPAYQGDEPYIFVSYDHDDAGVVYPEISRLRGQGFNIWYDEGIAPGATWRDEVAEALSNCSLVLYFITPQSVLSSNCLKEINYALSRDLKILAVHLQQTRLPPGLELSLSDMQAVIREHHAQDDYESKLTSGVRSLMAPSRIDVQPISRVTTSQPSPTPEPDPMSIAVLPFVNRSADAENEYLCDGISEALISGLAQVKSLHVASQLSSFTFKGKTSDIRTVGAALSVASVLSGSVQKSGNRLRISVSLDQVNSGTTLWSQRYDREMADIFDVQDDVAHQVIDALKVELDSGQTGRLIDVGTSNSDAYEAYLLGNYEFQKWTYSGFTRAISLYEQATRHDDGLANAHGRAGLSYMELTSYFGVEPSEVRVAVKQAFHRARSLGFDPHATMFANGARYTWHSIEQFLARLDNPETASSQIGEELRNSLVNAIARICDPTDPRNEGDPGRGYEELRRVLVMLRLRHANLEFLRLRQRQGSPVDYDLADALIQLGRHEEAIDHCSAVLEGNPDHHFSRHLRALSYVRTGQLSKAEADLALLDRVWGKSFGRFLHHYWCGEIDQAREYFLTNFAEHPRFELRLKAIAWVMLSEFEKALETIEGEPTQTQAIPYNLRLYAPVHLIEQFEQEPRYQAWLVELGFDDEVRQEAIDMLNQVSHVTGITVRRDEEYETT